MGSDVGGGADTGGGTEVSSVLVEIQAGTQAPTERASGTRAPSASALRTLSALFLSVFLRCRPLTRGSCCVCTIPLSDQRLSNDTCTWSKWFSVLLPRSPIFFHPSP